MSFEVSRRQFVGSTLAAMLPALHVGARAQSYPTRPIRIVVPSPAGGAGDVIVRAVGQRLATELGQPVVVENRAGAGAMIGMRYVAKSVPADGYTFVFATNAAVTIGPMASKSAGFSPQDDLTPVVGLTRLPLFICVPASSPYRTISELIQAGRQPGSKLSFGTSGVGALSHLTGLAINSITGANFQHIPYKGGAPLSLALMAGELTYALLVGGDSIPHVKSGKMRMLAVTDSRPTKLLPEVPTMKDAGYPDFPPLSSWFSLFAPARTPQDIVQTVSRKVAAILTEPEFTARFEKMVAEAWPANPAELGEALRRETVLFSKIIAQAGITLE